MKDTITQKHSLEDCLKLAKEIPIDQWVYSENETQLGNTKTLTAANIHGDKFDMERRYSKMSDNNDWFLLRMVYDFIAPCGGIYYELTQKPAVARTSSTESDTNAVITFEKVYGFWSSSLYNAIHKLIHHKPSDFIQLAEFYHSIEPTAFDNYLKKKYPDERERLIAEIQRL
ncbi:MAG: hypothetical protein WC916_01265 [Candidatus Woesearchaeota archaeon]